MCISNALESFKTGMLLDYGADGSEYFWPASERAGAEATSTGSHIFLEKKSMFLKSKVLLRIRLVIYSL